MRAAAVVVNFNGGADLSRCLAALAAQTVPVEVVVVDCASTDGSRSLVERPPEGVVGVPLADNRGYAGGCNAGLAAAGAAEAVGFFNPDCVAEPGLFAAALAVLAGDGTVGGVAARLEREDRATLDSCGQVLSSWLLMVRDRGFGEPAAGAFAAPTTVLAACGAGMVYRRTALDAVAVDGEVFPSAFFAFWEDLDLGWRVRNAGWRVVYEPGAVAVHRRGATASPGRGRLVFRRTPRLAACILANRWATLVRNLHRLDFLARLPVLLLADTLMTLTVLVRRPAVLPALLGALPGVRLAWRQRGGLPRRRLRELA